MLDLTEQVEFDEDEGSQDSLDEAEDDGEAEEENGEAEATGGTPAGKTKNQRRRDRRRRVKAKWGKEYQKSPGEVKRSEARAQRRASERGDQEAEPRAGAGPSVTPQRGRGRGPMASSTPRGHPRRLWKASAQARGRGEADNGGPSRGQPTRGPARGRGSPRNDRRPRRNAGKPMRYRD